MPPSAYLVEQGVGVLGRPLVYSPHLHRSARLEGARVLGGLEMAVV